MITANPTTNTPLDNWPVSGKDADGPADAGAQGRAGARCTPETTRRHIALYAMATEGLSFEQAAAIDAPRSAIARSGLAMALTHGMSVWQQAERDGHDGVRSIAEARTLRILLGYAAGRFDGIEHDTMARDGVSLLHIAEIRMGIRTRNGDLRREWM